MQKILSFDTILPNVNVILQDGSRIIASNEMDSKKQSEILVSALEKTLSDNGLKYSDIDIFSSIAGPGNFTGIKTSLAVLKALQISTNKNVVLCDVFEIISYDEKDFDIILLDMGNMKYYIKGKDGNYSIIYKKDIQDFMEKHIDFKILTNDASLSYPNVKLSKFSNEKWSRLVYHKVQNGIFTDEITPLYIEEASVTKRKS